MNYKQKYYQEIFEQMLNTSLSNGLISHAEDFPSYIANKEDISNYYVMDKSVIAEMFQTVYEDMTNVYNRIDVSIAEGADLDNIGDIVGIIRPSATYAMCTALFSINVVSEDITIDEGVLLESTSGIRYRTLEKILLTSESTSCRIPCISLTPGVNGRIGVGTLTTIVTDLEVPLTVTNPYASTGGREAYDDDEYRELLMAWQLINLKGSLEAYENYFANFDGLDGFKIVPRWDGPGTVKVILDPGTDYQLNQAYEDIVESVAQIDTDVVMTAPVNHYIDVYVVCNVDIDLVNPYSNLEKETIASRINSGIKTFIDGGIRENGNYYQGLLIGEDFIPHKLAVFLDEEINELKDINFNYPTEYIPITDEEIGVAQNITIEMI